MFKVAKVDATPQKWAPTSMKNISYDDPRHRFNASAMSEMAQTSPAVSNMSQSYEQPNRHSPAAPTWNIPEAPPLPATVSPPSRKPANHIPGMVNPLICDNTGGDFGGNDIVRPNTDGGGATNKKMYSDSAFYDSPSMTYPTIQEQVAMAKEISNILESNQNKRSRGGTMFTKRKLRADEWSMNSQGQRREVQQVARFESLDSGMPAFSMQRKEFGYNHVRHHPDPIKSKIDAAELEQIQHNQDFLCKHDSLPPNMAFDINQALTTSHGKAGQFFEKRKQRAEKYVVDENSRRSRQQPSNTVLQTQIEVPDSSQFTAARPYKSPWEAAAEGRLDSAFSDMHAPAVYQQSPQPSPAMQTQPLNVITNQPAAVSQYNQLSQANVQHKTFKPVTPAHPVAKLAPGFSSTPKPRTRLEMMLNGSAGTGVGLPVAQPDNSAHINHNLQTRDVGVSQISPSPSNISYSQSSVYSPVALPTSNRPPSFASTSLKRPKDYLQGNNSMNGHQSTPISTF